MRKYCFSFHIYPIAENVQLKKTIRVSCSNLLSITVNDDDHTGKSNNAVVLPDTGDSISEYCHHSEEGVILDCN